MSKLFRADREWGALLLRMVYRSVPVMQQNGKSSSFSPPTNLAAVFTRSSSEWRKKLKSANEAVEGFLWRSQMAKVSRSRFDRLSSALDVGVTTIIKSATRARNDVNCLAARRSTRSLLFDLVVVVLEYVILGRHQLVMLW